MSFTPDIEVALLKFIASISDVEKDLENTRNQLALIPDFEPTAFFDYLDEAQKGYLSRHDFRVFLRKWDPVILEDEISHIFKHLDRNSDGRITREEFNKFVLPVDPVSYSLAVGRRSSSLIPYPPTHAVQRTLATLLVQESEVHRDLEERRRSLYCRVGFSAAAAFAFLDKAGFGSVRPSMVQSLLQASVSDGSYVSYDDVRLVFNRLDRDDDGILSYSEFAAAVLPEFAPVPPPTERITVTTDALGNTTRVNITSPTRGGALNGTSVSLNGTSVSANGNVTITPGLFGTSHVTVSSPVHGATLSAATQRVLGAPTSVTVSPSRFGATTTTINQGGLDEQRVTVREDFLGNTHVTVADSPSRLFGARTGVTLNGTTGSVTLNNGLGGSQTVRVSSPSRYGAGATSVSISEGILGETTTVHVRSPARQAREPSPQRTAGYDSLLRTTSNYTGLASPTRRETATLRIGTSAATAPVFPTEEVRVTLDGTTTVRVASPSRYGQTASVTVDGNTTAVVGSSAYGQTVRVSSPSRYGGATSVSITDGLGLRGETTTVQDLSSNQTIRVDGNSVTVTPMSLASRVGAILRGDASQTVTISNGLGGLGNTTITSTSRPQSPSFFHTAASNNVKVTTSNDALGNTSVVLSSNDRRGDEVSVTVNDSHQDEEGVPKVSGGVAPLGSGSPRLNTTSVSVRLD